MSYSNIKRFLSVALILAFASPATYAIYGNTQTSPYSSTMALTKDVKLTDKNELITLSLRDSDIKQVLRMFADKAGMNIIFHNSVEGKITLDLVETPINEAFSLILQMAGLNYYKQGNTMLVMSASSPVNATFSKQEMMVFPIKYASATKIAEFLNKNVFGMKKAGMSSIDAATVNPATNELVVFGMPSDVEIIKKVIEQFDREPYSKTFVVNHTTPAEMANMICNMMLPAHGIGTAKSKGPESAATTSADTLKLGEGIIACSIDGSNSDNVSRSSAALAMQTLSIAYFPQRGTITLMGGSEAQAEMIEKFIRTNDIKQPQALLEVSIVELNEAGSKEFQNQWNLSSKHWQANFDGSGFSGGRPGGRAYSQKQSYIWDGGSNGIYQNVGDEKVLVGWEGGAPNGQPYINNGVMTVPNQILRTIYSQVPTVHINWMINYLIENRKARVLANPKIIITNGQESTIDLTQDYVEKVTAEYLTSSVNGTGSTGTAQRDYTIGDDLGIKVSLTPFISPEGYVTLNIKPDYSTIAEQVYTTNETNSRDLAATLLSRRNLDLKNVRIKDGETLVIGGMIQETETKSVNKIPLLGDLPLIGSAFRSVGTTKTKSELVIMITPKILTDGEEGTVSGTL